MKKFLFKIIGIPVIGMSIMVLLFASLSVIMMRGFQGPTDSIIKLNQFELAEVNKRMVLFDENFYGAIVGKVEEYVIENNYFYIIGDYGQGSVIDKNGIEISPSEYFDYQTGKTIFYQQDDPVPRYLILNTKTAELRKYVEWNEIPEEDQRIFERAKLYNPD